MAKVGWLVVVTVLVGLLASCDCAVRGKRIKRGYNNGYGDSSGGYGRGSDERDASVSEEGGGCGGSSYGRGYGSNSGSRELAYNRDGRTSDTRGGRSFTKSSASAAASASAYNLKQRADIK